MNKYKYNIFKNLKRPINVFSNSNSNDNGSKIDSSFFLQKPYLRINYTESNIEEDIDLKNQIRIKSLPDPFSIREAVSKNYADSLLNDPSILKNTVHIDLNDRNITNARFIKVKQLPQIDSQLTAKLYVDNPINEPSLVRNNQAKDFSNNNLTNIKSIFLNTQAVNDNQLITKAYVDQIHQANEQPQRDLGLEFYDDSSDLVKNDQDNDFNENKLTNLDSVVVNRNPTLDNELANKLYIDDELDKNTIVRFNQNLENYLKVSVGNDTYNLTRSDKIQITDTTKIKAPNDGGYLLQNRVMKCNDKNGNDKISNINKSTKTNSPTGDSGATSLPPISDSFMYIETSSNYNGDNIFRSFKRTDIKQSSNIPFYYNRFSARSTKSMGRFRIQLLLDDTTWSTRII